MAVDEHGQALKKWEYMEIARNTESYLVLELNQLGQEGWEMVAVFFHKVSKSGLGSTDAWTAFLKRPFTGQLDKEKGAATIDVKVPSMQASDAGGADDIFDIED